MIQQMIILILLTGLPLFELRFSIPVAILGGTVELPFHIEVSGFGWSWYSAFLFCVVVNIFLGPVVFAGINLTSKYLLKIPLCKKIFEILVARSRKKVEKLVARFGTLGVALFIGVPLPGSGSYSGALGAWVLGLTPLQFFKANILGVLIAGSLVTIATVTGESLFKLITG